MTTTRALRRLLVAHVVGLWALVAAAPFALAAPEPQAELALRVDDAAYTEGRVQLLEMEARRALVVARVAAASIKTEGRTTSAVLRHPETMDRAIAALRLHFGLDEVAPAGEAPVEVSIRQESGSMVSASLVEAGLRSGLALATSRSIERIRRDLMSFGGRDASVTQDDLGVIRIRASRQAIERLKTTADKRSSVSVRRLPEGSSDGLATAEGVQGGTNTLRERSADGVRHVEVYRRILFDAQDMVDAREVVDPVASRSALRFRLDRLKAGRWSKEFSTYVGSRVGVVFDDEIGAIGRLDRAPGLVTGQISGDFPVDKAIEVAALLRLGMNPVPLIAVEDVSLGDPGAPQRAPN